MSNKTTNYGLTKPLAEESYDIDVQNGNMDIVDVELKKLNDGKAPSGHGLGDIAKGYTSDLLPMLEKGGGFYTVTGAKDSPTGTTNWVNLLQLTKEFTEEEGTGSGVQIVVDSLPVTNNQGEAWIRTIFGGSAKSWNRLIHTGNIAKYANVKIKCGTYQGNGNYGSSNPNNLPFDFKPQIVLLMDDGTDEKNAYICVRPRNNGYSLCSDASSTLKMSVIWGEKGISWYKTSAANQLNSSGKTYHYIAIGV